MIDLLAGKRILVTGGASGIGAGVARIAAETGGTVIVADRDEAGARQVAGSLPGDGHRALAIDVASVASVEAAFRTIGEEDDALDALIHCAGVWKFGHDGAIDRVDDAVWAETIAVNLTGTFLVCRAAVPILERSAAAAIVTVASVAALAGFQRTTAYAASKGGIVALSRVMALDLAGRGIRVNCLCPGVVETELTRAALSRGGPDLPIGRLGTPEDIARTAVFLASDWAAFTTGTVQVVDGGFVAT